MILHSDVITGLNTKWDTDTVSKSPRYLGHTRLFAQRAGKCRAHVNSGFGSMWCVCERVSHSSGGINCMLFYLALRGPCFHRERSKIGRWTLCAWQRDWEETSEMHSLADEGEEERNFSRWSLSISPSVLLHVSSRRCSAAPPAGASDCLDTLLSLWANIQYNVLKATVLCHFKSIQPYLRVLQSPAGILSLSE